MNGKNLSAARAAWGAALPDWVARLAEEADASSQIRAAERLGISGSAVNSVIRNRYPAGTENIERLVRGRLMDATVECPELGTMAVDVCRDHQDRADKHLATSSHRVRMRHACRACPLSKFAKETAA